ncbi:MAG: DUF3151 domain-containing protein [Ilumatobacteraceae bacterium]|nr:DUF3151 domain-containing protein [Ilumatobacteraceae bacterium]
MADDPAMQPIGLSTQPPSTVIPPAAPEVRHELAEALAATSELRVAEVSSFVARHPRDLHGWAALTECVGEQMWKYSAARVGYHRGLDALRANGWRGSGYVSWAEESNQGFLRCLLALQNAAAEIGEADEAERCALFLLQLDPKGVPAEFGAIAS